VIVKDTRHQYDGLQTSLGLQRAGMAVRLFVLHHVIRNMDDAVRNALRCLDQIGAKRFSNNRKNAERYGFVYLTTAEAADSVKQADIVLPL
jgi:hypothetical protein